MVSDASLQIFLTIYHGQLLATFFYDYVVRNTVRLFFYSMSWNMVTNVIVGLLFSIGIIWAILSVWSKIRRNLIITTVVLIIMLIVRLAVGIPYLMDRRGAFDRRQYSEELAVFITQMLVHFVGVVATWMLAAKQTPTI
jgi:hypothetical protein